VSLSRRSSLLRRAAALLSSPERRRQDGAPPVTPTQLPLTPLQTPETVPSGSSVAVLMPPTTTAADGGADGRPETGATGPRTLREARGSGALLPLAQPLSPRRDPGRARTRAPVCTMRPALSPPYSASLGSLLAIGAYSVIFFALLDAGFLMCVMCFIKDRNGDL
jgi:hypothetical protein